jgi:hypothetical protein
MFLARKIIFLNYTANILNEIKKSRNKLLIYLFIAATQNTFYLQRNTHFDYLT